MMFKPIREERLGLRQSVAGWEIQPAARLSGWRWRAPEGQAAGAFLHLSPTHVLLHHPDGSQNRLELPIPTKDALLGMLAAAAGIAGVAIFLIALLRLWQRRAIKSSQEL
ncbi:MAG: CRISPR-associated protein Cas5 [Caldilineales bacterium]|nr:CRISPR-associated protein Cas5 [Caldilineales bacterium]